MMNPLITQCAFPVLPEKFDTALRSAVNFIMDRYEVSGIIASGTILRGKPDPSSDLDIYVIHLKDYRQRVQRFFNGVPAEIFINPPQAVLGYFEEEQADRRPLTAHMLSTGFVILDLHPVVQQLRQQAARFLADPPEAPQDLTTHRYMLATLFEDALDIATLDPANAQMILSRAVAKALEFCFIKAGLFLPRHKALLDELSSIDAQTAALARQYYHAPTLEEKLDLALQIADRTIQARGFFEWETSRLGTD